MKVHLWTVAVTATLSSALFIPTSQQALKDLDLNDIDINDKAALDDYLLQLSLLDAASEIENNAEDYDNDYFDDDDYDDAEYLPLDITELPPFSQLHPPHHPPSDKTIYELITESKYTTILAKLIKEDEELVHLLNSTEANHTFFAPTDDAFKKIRTMTTTNHPRSSSAPSSSTTSSRESGTPVPSSIVTPCQLNWRVQHWETSSRRDYPSEQAGEV
ncbi:Fasciclin domain family protein [Aspergillus arachidicola]|uniref:Fasciclin domain family protein n=1 Tax=Aspergillus arachidicola TaxID=656916 RepID=A0A2G7FY99_9EURO|nr:Fasciclin domain family protein [Aspergillus arachidicola]